MLDAEDVALPPGDWYDFWSGARHAHDEKIQLHPRLDEMPLYVRAGAIVPMQSVVQNTGETPDGPLQLHIYPGEDCRGSLYQDDGHSFAYQKGENPAHPLLLRCLALLDLDCERRRKEYV